MLLSPSPISEATVPSAVPESVPVPESPILESPNLALEPLPEPLPELEPNSALEQLPKQLPEVEPNYAPEPLPKPLPELPPTSMGLLIIPPEIVPSIGLN